jgi:hypothetical protein
MISKIRFSNKAISASGGLVFFQDLIEKTGLDYLASPSLPTPKIKLRTSSFDKFKSLVLGLIQGAECLDDMDRCHGDPIFSELCGAHLSPTSYGNFLRSFDKPRIASLAKSLSDHAAVLHQKINPKGPLILDIDSTSHIQHGSKIEGIAHNYTGERCLDSLQVFDQFGLAYHLNVREGATFTAQNAPFVIEELGRRLRKSFLGRDRILRADSGFCNNQVFEACEHASFDFVIAMRENLYAPLFRRRLHWKRPKAEPLLEEGIEFAESLYHSKLCGKLYRVVLMRKPVAGPRPIFEDARWEYYGWITTIGSEIMKAEDVIFFYRKRGHAENFIRELKNGFDLHHFPCRKLDANRVYGIIAAFAYNLMRFMSLITSRGKPEFAKKLRFRLVSLAAQVVRQARQTHIVFPKHLEGEIRRCLMNINQLGSG